MVDRVFDGMTGIHTYEEAAERWRFARCLEALEAVAEADAADVVPPTC